MTDQAGNQRVSAVDGLGRLSVVAEYPGSGSYTTIYYYDVLGDLTSVDESGQWRTFVYDSLKRLIAATNPETSSANNPPALGCGGGTYAACYSYDNDGNLVTKTDNRGLQVSYTYDSLNRVKTKSYNGTTAVTYTYDASGANSKGRLSSVATSQSDASTTAYTSYDAVGHVLSSNQTTAGNTYSFGYTYNLAGALTSETYPSGRVVSTCYDGANRVSIVSWHGCGNLLGWFATNVTYAAHGAVTLYQMGNNVWHNVGYNSRLQMSGFTDAVNNSNNSILLTASLNWGSSNNNGNLQNVSYNNGGPGYPSFVTFNQSFTYDGLNRLKTATDSGGWSRSFAYDAYGNMTPSGTPAPPTVSFTTNNQIVSAPYDQAGNLTSANGNTLGYDFESRIVSETDGVSKAVETYVVDGNGNRVEKYGPGGAGKSVFVYDALGRMAAEYTNFSETPNCLTCYLTPDHLGTARVVTDQSGNVVARHDYLPFGEEVAASQYGRDTYWGPGSDTVHQKFTGKERDSESGLDYFGARYYGSALGRFTSVDPENAGSDPSNPQSWNAYSYVLNSPLSNTDPDGEDTCKDGSYADVCVTDTPPDPIQTVPFPRGPSQQPPTSNPAPVQPGPVFNTPSWNNNNCVTGFAIAGAGVFGAMGADVGFDIGAVGGAAAGTLVEPGGGTLVGGVAGGVGGAAFGGGLGAYYGGRFGASLGSIVCASGSGSSGGVGGATGGSGASANDNKKADDLIRGRLKASKSYHAEYGSKTYGEIKNLAKQGDRSAQQMKKLIEQGDRLMQKLGGK